MSVLADLSRFVDLTEPRFCFAVIAIIFNPFFWNGVARWEHRTRGLTRLFGGPYEACYFLGVLILLLNVYRSHSITVAMKGQPHWELLDNVQVYYAGAALMALGSLFVFSSFLALGFTGTFLGDYFGILMDQKVTGFPSNVMDNPMYWGSTANYLGLALIRLFLRLFQSVSSVHPCVTYLFSLVQRLLHLPGVHTPRPLDCDTYHTQACRYLQEKRRSFISIILTAPVDASELPYCPTKASLKECQSYRGGPDCSCGFVLQDSYCV
ncbi:phosphatidylethanolamine N-methyltransferase-like [Xyrauchen texanus]|uniref:phosphatidylethanolamine N-methyltransferase-like n=1 Tax=Xyrauchen texanus TaxID=154827 RepID=UPI0022429C74|nr:phosphatidylethanolamine N-methyltransferase-like [Xyrauchen texanus]